MPWEIAQAQQEKMPWDIAAEAQARPTQLGLPTVQEQHPDISILERAAVKNFGSDNPLDTIDYIKKNHPDMEVTTDATGQVIMRNKGEKQYRVLDPQTGAFSWDAIKDVLVDSPYDIASGVGSGALTALAGLAGAGAGGVGAIPAAIGAGAASSSGLEALRQAVGKGLGVRQEFSPGEVALAGGVGAVSPMLMGTGATAKQAAKWGVNQATQAGLLRRGTDLAFHKGAGTLSGLRPAVVKNFEKNYPQIKKMSGEEVTAIATDTADSLAEKLRTVELNSWQKFEGSLANSTDQVDISGAKSAFDKLEQQAIDRAQRTKSDKQKGAYWDDVAAIREAREKIFPDRKSVV